MSRGDRVVVMATEERGEILDVARDGYLLIALDDRPLPNYAPVPFHATELEWCA